MVPRVLLVARGIVVSPIPLYLRRYDAPFSSMLRGRSGGIEDHRGNARVHYEALGRPVPLGTPTAMESYPVAQV